MLAKKYRSKVVSLENPITGIYLVEFQSLGRRFKYQPGQFLHIALDKDYDGSGQWPESRCFSIQSNPNEKTIRITYSVKGDFTKQMKQTLCLGLELWLKLPYGDLFTQPHDKQNTVFIAGGTGITPFLSLFTHEAFNLYESPRLYFGFRSKKHNVYNEDLKRFRNSEKTVMFYYQNVDGKLDINQIFKENNSTQSYFISGPPVMVKTFKDNLIEKGIKVQNILTDDWE